MELVSPEAFISWAKDHGIDRDPRYPKAVHPTFLAEGSTWYRYCRGEMIAPWAFREWALRVAAAGSPLWLFPWPGGRWFEAGKADGPWSLKQSERLRALGVPKHYGGAARVGPGELDLAAGLFAVAMDLEAVCTVVAVPEHGRCIIRPDHDGDLMVMFPNEGACESFTRAFREAGWREPTGPDPRVSETDPWLDR